MRTSHILFPLFLAAGLFVLRQAAAAPDPTTVYAWFKADSGTLTNAAGTVTNWQNQATSGTPANRDLTRFGGAPRLVSGSTPTGQKPLLRFAGDDNLYGIPASFGTLASNRTIAAYVQLHSTVGGFLFDGATSAGMNRAHLNSGQWQVGIQPPPLSNGNNADPATLAATAGLWQLHFFSFELLGTKTRVTHSLWGGASLTYTNAQTNALGGLIVGENVAQALGLPVDVAELLVYDRVPAAAERQDLAAYLTNKWGSPVEQTGGPDPATVYAWYRGDAGLMTGGDNYSVTSWTNTGAALTTNATQWALRDLDIPMGSPQKRYLLRNNGAPAAALAFSGTDGIYVGKADFGILSSNHTLMACARVFDSLSQGFLFDASSYTPGLMRAQVKTGYWHVGTSGGTNASYGPSLGTATSPVTTNLWQVHAFIVQTNQGAAKFEHYLDGVQVGDVSLATNGSLSGLIVGANVSQQFGIKADLAELLVFNQALDAATRAGIESYLSNKWSGAVTDTNVPVTPPERLPLFVNGQDGYACYRIPAIVTTTNGTVIAVADGRISDCGDIPNPLDLVARRSFDNGLTWGPLQVIAAYGSDTSTNDVDTYPYYSVTNPVQRVAAGDAALLLDRTNGRVWTLYDNGAYVAGQAYNRVIKLEMRYSNDDGATWSDALDIEALNPGLRPAGSQFLAGPGNGIQLEGGSHAGRLIFPVYLHNSPYYSTLIYSDDHGLTWHLGGNAGTGGGEVQMAETPDGGLIASMRDTSFAWSGVRTFSRSTDGGMTWGAPFTNTTNPPSIADPACQGNIYRLTTTNDSNASRLIHANAANASSRVNMTLRISYDEGATWPVSNQVYAGSSAYSSLTRLATTEVGLLFEADNYKRIDFVRRSVSHISGGSDALPPYTVWAAEHFSPAQLMNPAISGPDADPDHDGATNNQESIAGTDPLSAASSLELKVIPSGTNSSLLEFNAVSNKTYTVQHRASLISGTWSRYVDVSAPPSNMLVQLALVVTNDCDFFRLTTPQMP